MNINTKATRPRPPRVYSDWQLAAELFGQGFGVAEVAAALRCPVAKVQRNLRESRRFRRWIAEAQARVVWAEDVARRRRRQAELRLKDLELLPDLPVRSPARLRAGRRG